MTIERLEITQKIIHYGGHFILPFLVARLFFKDQWKRAGIIMTLTILVDLDHLLADPIFDPERCSIGFHILHSYVVIGIYIVALFIPNKTIRIIAVGLLLHMLIDYQDCLWM